MDKHNNSYSLEDGNDSNTVAGNIASCTFAGSLSSTHIARASLPSENDCEDLPVRFISDMKGDMASFTRIGTQCNSIPQSVQRPTNRKMRRFVPTYRKDEYYWMKRKKNNEAARKSREKRRQNDAVLARTVMRLLKENNKLKRDLLALRVKYNDIDSTEVEMMERYLDEQQFAVDEEGMHWDEQQNVSHDHHVHQILKEQCGFGVAVSLAQDMQDDGLWKATKSTLKEEHVPNGNLEKMTTEYSDWKNHYIHNFDHNSVKCEQRSFSDAPFVISMSTSIREKMNHHKRNSNDENHCFYSGPNLSPNSEKTEQDHHEKECFTTKHKDDHGDKVLSNETSTDSSSSFDSCNSTPTMSPKQNSSPEDNRYSYQTQEKTQKLPYKLRFKLAALQS